MALNLAAALSLVGACHEGLGWARQYTTEQAHEAYREAPNDWREWAMNLLFGSGSGSGSGSGDGSGYGSGSGYGYGDGYGSGYGSGYGDVSGSGSGSGSGDGSGYGSGSGYGYGDGYGSGYGDGSGSGDGYGESVTYEHDGETWDRARVLRLLGDVCCG